MGFFKNLFSNIFNKSKQNKDANFYGQEVDFNVAKLIKKLIPNCDAKNNIIVESGNDRGEIDCLIKYLNKLFLIKVKSRDSVKKVKINNYKSALKSPYRQAEKEGNILKKYTGCSPRINSIVFFKDVKPFTEKKTDIHFSEIKRLANYIQNEGSSSFPEEANRCFEKAKEADYLSCPSLWGETSLHCSVDSDSLKFITSHGITLNRNIIQRINVEHTDSGDKIFVRLINGKIEQFSDKNRTLKVKRDGKYTTYPFSKIDTVVINH